MNTLTNWILFCLAFGLLTACNQPASAPTQEQSQAPPATATAAPETSESPEATKSDPEAEGFNKTVKWLDEYVFQVNSEGARVTVDFEGPEEAESRSVDISGSVTDAEAEDINGDGVPEVFIYVESGEENGPGQLVGFTARGIEVSVPPLSTVEGALEGYRGGDQFRLVENRIVQRWPLYKEGDPDDQPSGGQRQIQWRMEKGEATWTLAVDKTVDF